MKESVRHLKSAEGQIKSPKKINADYQKVKKNFTDMIKISKDSNKILATIKKFDEFHAAAERKLRATTVTIKKASGKIYRITSRSLVLLFATGLFGTLSLQAF